MKTLSTVLVLLFITVVLTLAAVHNPGYVLIERSPWSLEMPLTLFALLLVATVGILYFALHVVLRLLHIPRDVGRWRLDRRVRHLQRALHMGLAKLLEGDHAGAERDLVSDLKAEDVPGIHYLAAACAAQGQGQHDKRDEYLTLAQAAPELTLATGLLQAHLFEATREYERSLATLSALRIAHPGNRTVLRFLAQRARGLRDWTVVAHLVPELRRYKAMDAPVIDEWEIEAHRQLLLVAMTHPENNAEAVWHSVPKNRRQHPVLVAVYARGLIRRGEAREAEQLLVAALRQQPVEDLFLAYSELPQGTDSLRLLSQAEAWLKSSPENGSLLLCLTKLALGANLPGKAREYAERCARQSPTNETYAELAQTMERLGDEERAREYYRRGLDWQRGHTDHHPETALLPF